MEQEAIILNSNPEHLTELASQSEELARLVAQNPHAPSELLEKLSQSKDRLTREAVTGNPNTATEVLFELGKEFPEQLLENPAFPLLSLKHPNFLERMPSQTLYRLLDATRGKEALLESLCNHPSFSVRHVGGHFLFHNHFEREWLERFVESPYQDIRAAIASKRSTPISVLEKLSKDSDSAVRAAIASNRSTPISVLEKLLKDSDSEVRAAIASNRSTPISVFEKLLEDSDSSVRVAIAANHHTPISVFEKLLKNSDSSVRVKIAIAANGHGPISVFEKLSEDSDSKVRAAIAANGHGPISVFEKLLEDSDSEVRIALAANYHTPISVLEKLLEDSDSSVRVKVAENPRTPISVLEKLSNPEHLTELASQSEQLSRLVAKNPHAPSGLLEKLSQSKDRLTREAVTGNPNTATEVLFELGKEFPEQLLENPVFPLLSLEHPNFLEIMPSQTRYRLLNSTRGKEALLELFCNHPSSSVRRVGCDCLRRIYYEHEWLERFVESPYEDIRTAIAANHRTPIPVLEKLSKDSNSFVRAEVASNPTTPVSILAELIYDSNSGIRERIVKDKRLPASILEEFCRSTVLAEESVHFRLSVARRVQSAATLELLGKDCHSEVRKAVAKNQNTPVSVLELLANHDFPEVRRAVAKNPTTPVEILHRLASDRVINVRTAVARNPSTARETLEILACDSRQQVRTALAKNPSLELLILEMLAGDEIATVRQSAIKKLSQRMGTLFYDLYCS
ncbi:HEAT repeat domain-containing protein [Oscillatoria sp. FACHB-1406]|uniref:HEAT repeat domain-containing protein n=1 Tax=Oscillatoria sp. FACHB-1406 TaxID=2692846 RepID=UPI0016867147|nr:HEAT repeat domain-containing protein [Oscillatoria sp. FACHB-1406]MBD2579267.1 hypothetical protein [Oscillatoria sp. FACHB-1406]